MPKPLFELKFNKLASILKLAIPVVIMSLLLSSGVFAQTKEHTIKSGETLSSIAKKYNTTLANLYKLNPEAKSGIKAGGVLKVQDALNEQKADTKVPIAQTSGTQAKHLVISGESFYKIAKKYKVSVSDLERWNGYGNSGLKSGNEIWVKAPDGMETPVEKLVKENQTQVEEKQEVNQPATDPVEHKIVKGETLSTIAKKYGTTVAELKSLNNLKNNQVNLGQIVKVTAKPIGNTSIFEPEKSRKQVEPTKQTPDTEQATKAEPRKEVKPEPVKIATPVIQDPVNPEPDKEIVDTRANTGSIREVNNSLGYTRVVETGFAEAIEGDVNSKKHLCLHKTAPSGSILQVKNEANGQSVFVKVIGKLPETGSNEKLIIRISRQAYDRLLAVGKRFAVEVSYPQSQ